MIFIISTKDFLDKPKKLYKARELHIINGSDSEELSKFGDSTIVYDLQPQKSLIRKEEKLSKEEISSKTKKFIKSPGVSRVCATAIVHQLNDPESNVFIILKNSVYKVLADKFVNRFNKIVELDEGDLFIKYSDFSIMCDWYRKHIDRQIEKYDEKYDKIKYDRTKSMRDKSDKLDDLNDRLDALEDAYDEPDKVEARKLFVKEAKPSKATVKKMKKFLKDNSEIFSIPEPTLQDMR